MVDHANHVTAEGTTDMKADLPSIETFPPSLTSPARGIGRRPIVVSIGILAYNEESAIAQTVKSIAGQTLVSARRDDHRVELICVANGCRDRTAELAAKAIDKLQASDPARISGRVEIIDRPSKENAWNEFVHRLSRRDADVLVFLDGDVRLLDPETLRSMADTLLSQPRAYVCGARTVKHLELSRRRRWIDRVSLAATAIRRHSNQQSARTGFAGCLYAARTEACRRFRLPTILKGEDCFLHAMWATDFFTVAVNAQDPTRIVTAPQASVLFEAYTSPLAVVKNLRRRAVEITINSMLYDRLWSESSPNEDAGALLLRWHREDPRWEQRLLEQKINERGSWLPPGGPFLRWVSPRGSLWHWFRRMKGMRWHRKILHAPVAALGTCLTFYAYVSANRLIRAGKLDNLWFTTATRLDVPRPDPTVAVGVRSPELGPTDDDSASDARVNRSGNGSAAAGSAASHARAVGLDRP